MAIVRTATLRLETVRQETAEFVAAVKKTNADQGTVENAVFARKMSVSTAMNCAPPALNVRMKNAKSLQNAVLKTLAVPAKIVKKEFVSIETVELAVPVILL